MSAGVQWRAIALYSVCKSMLNAMDFDSDAASVLTLDSNNIDSSHFRGRGRGRRARGGQRGTRNIYHGNERGDRHEQRGRGHRRVWNVERVDILGQPGRGGGRGRWRSNARSRGSRSAEEHNLSGPDTPPGLGRSFKPNFRGGFGRGASAQPNTATPMTAASMRELSVLDPKVLVKKVDSQLKEFQHAIGKPKIVESMDAVIQILLKIAQLASQRNTEEQSTASKIIAEILSERSVQFHMQLSRAIIITYTTIQAQNFCNLFGTLLSTFESSAWDCLPIDDLHETVKRLTKGGIIDPSLLKRCEDLCKARDQVRDAAAVRKMTPTEANDERDDSEFRLIPLLPEWTEINRDNGIPPEVRPNKVGTPYKDWMQYYDIQFRLIREDFIGPLRRGVAAFLHGERGRRNRDVKTYSRAVIMSQLTTKDKGICFKVKFDVSGFQRVKYNWDQSKRLIFGSLLCFIPMGKISENSIMFATVADRDSKDLHNGNIMVQFEGDILDAMSHCRNKTEFEIVESNSYFGATSPILRSIQKAEVETMPFTKQLIKGECDNISPPAYLQTCMVTSEPPIYDMSCLHGSLENRRRKPPLKIDVLDPDSWEQANNTELDASQLHAIQTALTQEIAVIQGPPGTGKTYIGLKIVEALLQNRRIWDPFNSSPILVMCYTNHALDQFLEGIIDTKSTVKVVRVGGRCKSEKVDEYNLNKIRRNLPRHHYDNDFSHEFWRLKEEMEECNPEGVMQKLNLHYRSTTLLPLNIIQCVAHPDHFYQLTEMVEYKGNELEFWLGLWEKSSTNTQKENLKYVQEMSAASKRETAFEEGVLVPKQVSREVQSSLGDAEKNEVSSGQKMETENDQNEEAQSTGEELLELEDEATVACDDRMNDDDREGYQIVELPNNNYTDEPEENYPVLPLHYYKETSADESEDSDPEIEEIKSKFSRRGDANAIIKRKRFESSMDEEEAQNVYNIRTLSMNDRWRLYNFWEEQRYKYLLEINRRQVLEYSELCKKLSELRQEEDRYVLERTDVVGMTTTGAAKYQHILHKIKPKIVIVEEAAEVLEAHIVSALSAGTQHLILIGDHKQLRPKPNEYELATKYNLSISLFERLVKKELSQATLEIQHRMRPEIARLVCPHVYDKLLNHESVEKYPDIRGISKNLYFIHHNEPESENTNLLSYQNEFEAEYVVSLCAHLLNLGYSSKQITILTPYIGQLLKLRNYMPRNKFEGIRVTAIDNFQGEENDIILFSMVRSTNPNSTNTTIGFLKEDNRVCVSLSRAKHGFYVIGNFQLIRHQSQLWESIISDVDSRNCYGDALPLYCCNHPTTKYSAKKESDFLNFSPNGGCQKMCDIRLPCGHSCTRKCHIIDVEHKTFECTKTCERSCSYNHPCKTKHYCHEECPPCREMVERVIPKCGHTQSMECHDENPTCFNIVSKIVPLCGHVQDMYCSTNPYTVPCNAPCSKSCKNGHPCQNLCHEDCGNCLVEMEKEIPVCAHKQMVPCHLYPILFKCQAPCPKLCSANLHWCPKKCSEPCENCKEKVEKTLPVCGHVQEVMCYKTPNPKKCKIECVKQCPNGLHTMRKICRDEWQQCKVKVMRQLKCGHSKETACFKDPSSIICRNPCTKSCVRGHACPKTCHEECGPCVTKVEKTLLCGHTLVSSCALVDTQKCPVQCSKVCCERGHVCKEICHFPLPCSPCNVRVTTRMPVCLHEQTLKCYVSNDPQKYKYSCKRPCEKKLDCEHVCQKKCGEICQIICTEKVKTMLVCGHPTMIECHRKRQKEPFVINCKALVTVELACSHTITTECWETKYKSSLKNECKEVCIKLLKCGHKCQNRCGNACTTNCKELVTKRWPCGHELKHDCYKTQQMKLYPCNKQCHKKLSCGHPCLETCSKPCTERCWKMVQVKLPCGHQIELKCFQRKKTTLCTKQCKKKLLCGHQCKNQCGEPCSTCDLKSTRRYPCGHSSKIPCNATIEKYPCRKKCQEKLSCGHCCSGKCGDCYSTRMHAICIFQVRLTRYCGHTETMSCAGLTDECNHPRHEAPCIHSESYSRCCKLCEWNCKHFECENVCSEECARPRCNAPCDSSLVCSHRCPGLCGEKCISICPQCDTDKFMEKLHPNQKRSRLSRTGPFYELECGHIFTVQYLDEYIIKQSNSVVMPRQCPKCHQNMMVGGRYGNEVRKAMTAVIGVMNKLALIPRVNSEQLLSTVDGWKKFENTQFGGFGGFGARLNFGFGTRLTDTFTSQPTHDMNPMYSLHYYQDAIRPIRKKLYGGNDPVTHEESCFVQCIDSYCTLFISLRSYTKDDAIHRIIDNLKTLAIALVKGATSNPQPPPKVREVAQPLIPEQKLEKVHLSLQLLGDFRSELYRLSLHAQCIIANNQASPTTSEKIEPVKTVEQFLDSLNPLQGRISNSLYEHYSDLIETAIPNVANLHVQTPQFPPITKGKWIKCTAGHYYCIAPVFGGETPPDGVRCPECLEL